MSDIKMQFFHNFLLFRIDERDGNGENRLLCRRKRDRRGLHHGCGTRPLFSRGRVSSRILVFLCAVFLSLRLFSLAREKVRRVRRRAQSGVRAGRENCPRPLASLRLCAVRRDARGARRALPGGKTALGDFGARGGVGARAPRHEGGHRAQLGARSAPHCVRPVRCAGRRFIGSGNSSRVVLLRRCAVCGNEPLSHCACAHGAREGGKASRVFCGRRRRRGRSVRRLHLGARLRSGRRCAPRGDAVSCRHARKPPLLRRGGSRHLYLPCRLALSAPFGMRKGARQEKIRRRGRGTPCGVCLFEIGTSRHRRRLLSRRRRSWASLFSCLCSSRVPFQAPPRESTCPQRECRG